jgi:hypothetical protein
MIDSGAAVIALWSYHLQRLGLKVYDNTRN